jgi:hypothetical protein
VNGTSGTEARSAGQELTATLRRYFSVGPRSRRYRKDRYGTMRDLHADMIEALYLAAQYPGYYVERTQSALATGFGAALSYTKHVSGYRIDGTLRRVITEMSPWRFAAMLGAMVDAGVTCTGDGERYFADMARAMRAEKVPA